MSRTVTYFISLFFIISIEACTNSPGNSGSGSGRASTDAPSEKASTSISTDSPAANNVLPDSFSNKLIGKWLRSDGTYTLEVFSTGEKGIMDAGYFNPNPIHVEKSEWKITDNKLYMRVILKDVNYPGSTYTLIYFPEKDQLEGNYFQAVEGYNYDVTFQRVKEK